VAERAGSRYCVYVRRRRVRAEHEAPIGDGKGSGYRPHNRLAIIAEVRLVKKLTLISLALSLLGAVNAVGAQTITQGGPTGTLVSAFANADGPIYTTPSKGHFVLTQAGGGSCSFLVQGFTDPIGQSEAGSLWWLTFTPGLLLPPKTTLTISGSGGRTCYIIGVLEK
jgi:hypothetical protein